VVIFVMSDKVRTAPGDPCPVHMYTRGSWVAYNIVGRGKNVEVRGVC
jgi:hypothetical protein